MADIDPDKALAALEQLEAEKERRLQARVEAGEVVVQTVTVVVGARDENVEDACERALANLPTSTPDGRPIHHDLQVIVTGVPRDPDFARWETPQVQTASSKGIADPPDEVEPARGGEVLSPSPPSEPTYVRITIRNGGDDDPGVIAEGYYTVEDGAVILRDPNDKHLTSRALLPNEDPAAVARSLLREAEEPKDFQGPIHYPKLGLA
jgi:hypothetical protein